MIDNGAIYIFTDGSKSEIGTRAGFFCSNPYTEDIFKLNVGIIEVGIIEVTSESARISKFISLLLDSQAAIMAICSVYTVSR